MNALALLCLAGTLLAALFARLFSRMGIQPVSDLTAAAEHITQTEDLARHSLVVRDSGAPLTAGAGCTAIGAGSARCASRYPIQSAEVDLGDLDDTFSSVLGSLFLALSVRGGGGHDELTGSGNLQGGPGPDVLTGSAGQDTLSGGAGDDIVRGLGGDDELSGDGDGAQARDPVPGDDILDGGGGLDGASYSGRTAAVTVDLAGRAPDGGAGERDQLVGIENVTGGRGADVLSGDGGPNRLSGADGDDVLRGRGGDDRLTDGEGADAVYGGDGGDVLTASGAGDRAFGEGGDDRLTGGTGAALDGGAGDDALGVALGATYTSPVRMRRRPRRPRPRAAAGRACRQRLRGGALRRL
jgi:Ca2+-binding RTX toxin-like protein